VVKQPIPCLSAVGGLLLAKLTTVLRVPQCILARALKLKSVFGDEAN